MYLCSVTLGNGKTILWISCYCERDTNLVLPLVQNNPALMQDCLLGSKAPWVQWDILTSQSTLDCNWTGGSFGCVICPQVRGYYYHQMLLLYLSLGTLFGGEVRLGAERKMLDLHSWSPGSKSFRNFDRWVAMRSCSASAPPCVLPGRAAVRGSGQKRGGLPAPICLSSAARRWHWSPAAWQSCSSWSPPRGPGWARGAPAVCCSSSASPARSPRGGGTARPARRSCCCSRRRLPSWPDQAKEEREKPSGAAGREY